LNQYLKLLADKNGPATYKVQTIRNLEEPMSKLYTLLVACLLAGMTTAAAQTPEPLGIAVCDEFLTKYEACIAKMPATNQATFKGSLDQMRTGWKSMAANP
jgi:hypothetical protein